MLRALCCLLAAVGLAAAADARAEGEFGRKPPRKPGKQDEGETAPAKATISVSAEVVRKIPDLLYGSQTIWWPEDNGLPDDLRSNSDYRKAMEKWFGYLPTVREIGPTILRYPGGLEAMEFTWTDTIGPFEARPVNRWPRYHPGNKVAIGPDEFARFAQALGAETMITLNVNDVPVPGLWHSGSQQEAAAWVAYMNGREDDRTPLGADGNGREWGTAGDWAARRRENCEWINKNSGLPPRDCSRPYGVKYWEMGNECSYHTVWLFTSQTPARYGEIVARYGAAMRAVDPSIRIGAVGNDNPIYGEGAWKGWFGGVQTTLRDQVRRKHAKGGADFWVKHEYPPGVSPAAAGIMARRGGARLSWRQRVAEDGDYALAFDLYGKGGAFGVPTWELHVDGGKVAEGPATSAGEAASTVTTKPFPLAAGEHELALVAGKGVSPDRRLEFGLRAELRKAGAKAGERVNLRGTREAQALMLAAGAVKAALLPEPKEALGGRPVFITEFGHDWRFRLQDREHEPVYLQDALGIANLYSLFLRSDVVGAALLWTLFDDQNEFGEIEGVAVENKNDDAKSHGLPPAGPRGTERGRPDPRIRPVGLAHKLMAEALRGELLKVELQASEFTVSPGDGLEMGFGGVREARLPWLDALAARRPDGGLALVAANRDPWNDIAAEIRIAGASDGAARVETLSGDGLMASNEPEDCPKGACVRIARSSAAVEDGALRHAFPAASLTAIYFSASE